jgi:hypothetical protein
MNKFLICLISIIIVLTYLGCGEKQQSEQTGESQKSIIKFVLNDGKKWQMDEHTRNTIKNLDSLLISQDPINTIEDYNLHGEKLDEELILLIRGCTMEGPAHDQLHIFLGYFYPKIQSLKKETNTELAKDNITEMENLFVEYHKYFE